MSKSPFIQLTPDNYTHKDHIVNVVDNKNGTLTIKTSFSQNPITITQSIEDFKKRYEAL